MVKQYKRDRLNTHCRTAIVGQRGDYVVAGDYGIVFYHV
jgi:hypothetical protein